MAPELEGLLVLDEGLGSEPPPPPPPPPDPASPDCGAIAGDAAGESP